MSWFTKKVDTGGVEFWDEPERAGWLMKQGMWGWPSGGAYLACWICMY